MLGDIWKGRRFVVEAEYFSLDTVIYVGSCCMLWCGLWLAWLIYFLSWTHLMTQNVLLAVL